MMAGEFALLALGALLGALAVWALWPRRQPRPGPANNWRQRGGSEIESSKSDGHGGTSPVDVALGLGD
ncbi:MAG TPA: hypothetical protein VF605_15970 [Allosphingosinicella sp.]|jgi:hypothetical protein